MTSKSAFVDIAAQRILQLAGCRHSRSAIDGSTGHTGWVIVDKVGDAGSFNDKLKSLKSQGFIKKIGKSSMLLSTLVMLRLTEDTRQNLRTITPSWILWRIYFKRLTYLQIRGGNQEIHPGSTSRQEDTASEQADELHRNYS